MMTKMRQIRAKTIAEYILALSSDLKCIEA
jgi:hypothetical protein